MKTLYWLGDNFPGLVACALAVWALVGGDHETARFFLLLMVVFGISRQVSDLRDQLDAER